MRDVGWGCPARVPAPQGNMATAARSPDSYREVEHLGCNINPPNFQMQLIQGWEGRGERREGGNTVACHRTDWPGFLPPKGNRDKESPCGSREKPSYREHGSPWLCPCSHLCPPGQAFQPRGLSPEVPVREVGAEDLRGADLLTKLGCFGKSRKEDVIIITLQNL